MAMLAFQKAFDTLNYQILISKLKAMGFNGEAVLWVLSYLTGRVQRVEAAGALSDLSDLTCRVPQGSTLGPLLFLLFINYMEAACTCPVFLYADDSAVLITDKCLETVRTSLGKKLKSVKAAGSTIINYPCI